MWLTKAVVGNMSPLEIAASSRFAGPTALALLQGILDPDAAGELRSIVSWFAGPAGSSLPPCSGTTKLIRAATSGWSPTSHWLHHTAVRTAVHTMLLVSARLAKLAGQSREVTEDATDTVSDDRPVLPPELWLVVGRFCLRQDWSVVIC